MGITPNARRLVNILAQHSGGMTCEDLNQEFRRETKLQRQSYYNALKVCRKMGWITGGGGRDEIYQLNPEAPWKASGSIGGKVGVSEAEQTRLELLVDTQAGEIQELQDQVDTLLAGSGSNGVAIEHLTRIVADTGATVRQRLRACSILLNYRSDPDTTAFARSFLEKVVSDPATPVDYKLEGLEQLRKAMGDPQLKPSIVKLAPPSPPSDPVKEAEERRIEFERKKQHCERQAQLDQEHMAQERERLRWRVPTKHVPASDN
jgi:Fe2+ or Zn2+ uptake regulation protein